jgi:hypothetical protein
VFEYVFREEIGSYLKVVVLKCVKFPSIEEEEKILQFLCYSSPLFEVNKMQSR